jgi:Fe-S cluster assembly scaffold protein SufB
MGIQSFLQAEKGDPDWLFSPDEYFGKQFKLSEANTVELKEGKKDQVVLRHTPTEKGLVAKQLKIDLRDNSQLDLFVLNDTGAKLQQVCLYDIHLREGSTLNLGIFVKGGKFNKHIFQVELDDGANFSNFGYMNNNDSGDTEVIFKVFQKGAESLCTQLIAGEAGPNSQTVYQSMVHIDAGAEVVETGIENINIVTGPNGKCYSRPDVTSENESAKIRYGSQTAFIDESMILYLNSKGLGDTEARNLILQGFKTTVFNLIQGDDLKTEVAQMFESD